MPRGISRKKHPELYKSAALKAKQGQALSAHDKYHMCNDFITKLIDSDHILNVDIFTLLNEEAMRHGYMISAEQRGIQGTNIVFRRM